MSLGVIVLGTLYSDISPDGKRDIQSLFSAIFETCLSLAIGVVVGRTKHLGDILAIVNVLNCIYLLHRRRNRSLGLSSLWTVVVIFGAAMFTWVRPRFFEDNLDRQSLFMLHVICGGLAGLYQLLRERKDRSPQWLSTTAVSFVIALPLVFLLLPRVPADISDSSQSVYWWIILALLSLLSIVTHPVRTPSKLDTKAIELER